MPLKADPVPVVSAERLDGGGQTLVLASFDFRLPIIAYWGPELPENADLVRLALSGVRPTGPAMLSRPVEISLCPEDGQAFPGEPGIRGSRANGTDWMSQFRVDDLIHFDAQTLHVEAPDPGSGLIYRATVIMRKETGVVEFRAELQNDRPSSFLLDWFAAPAIRCPSWVEHAETVTGRWCGEYQANLESIDRGALILASREGRPSHETMPLVALLETDATQRNGAVLVAQFASSSGHRMVIEKLANGETQLQFGEFLRPGELVLNSGETYRTPTLHVALSTDGRQSATERFHDHIRQTVLPASRNDPVRPVHFNCWEAIYFDHSLPVLEDLARRVAALGVERFVLDDGWFKGRADDTAGLGNWDLDPEKFPHGLEPLIDAVERWGMGFGIWVEPEMANRDSDLYREHPEWVLGPANPGHDQIIGRSQLVLDLSLSEVSDYLFDRLSELLGNHRIEYMKWDHNRGLAVAAGRGGQAAFQRQGHAVNALLERLTAAFPNVDIETCASGGARIDLDILSRCNRVWLSDSNDARERWRMQRVAGRYLPPEIIGSHVGPRHCHTTGRTLPMAFRAGVAAMRHMGLEMDPRELEEEEILDLQGIIAWYKETRDFLHAGRTVILDQCDPDLEAELVIAPDQSRFVLFAAQLSQSVSQAIAPLRLNGLDPNGHYRLNPVVPSAIEPAANRVWYGGLLDSAGEVIAGNCAMHQGIQLPNAFPDTLWIIEGRRL